MVSGPQILTVMRDHAVIGGVSGSGRLCMCREVFLTPVEHTSHVADAIAAAVREFYRARADRARAARVPKRDGRQLIPAGDLDLEQLGLRVVAPVPGMGDVTGVLLRADPDPELPDFVELELLPPGDAPPAVYPIKRGSWVEVYQR